jgi:hypothetical protein
MDLHGLLQGELYLFTFTLASASMYVVFLTEHFVTGLVERDLL